MIPEGGLLAEADVTIDISTLLLIVGGGLLFSALVFRIGRGTVHPDEVGDSRRARQAYGTLRWGSKWFPRIGIVVLVAGALLRFV
ncbi:MAG TPA: hypothetical protein VIC52_08365 [Actinomycetota bacterium]